MEKIIFAKIESEQGSLEKNNGCALAPQAILKKIKAKENSVVQIHVVQGNIDETDRKIFEKSRWLFQRNKMPVFLGGDHSISYSTVKAFSSTHKNPALIVFDAHPDCVQFFKPISHEDWIQGIVEENKIGKKNILLVGTRKIHKLEQKYLERKKIKMIKASEIKKNLGTALSEAENFLKKQENVYLSIDIDVFDPKKCPGTGYLEKNGLNEKEFFTLFGKILKSEKVKAVDLVEVNPKKDKKGKTIAIAGKILKKIIEEKEIEKLEEKQFALFVALMFIWNYLLELEKKLLKQIKKEKKQKTGKKSKHKKKAK